MKIITISIANRVDRPLGGLGRGEPWTNQPWSGGGWADWRDERIGPEAKRVLVQSNLRAAGLGMAARGKEHRQPPDNTENRGSRGVVMADETKGGEQNGETALDRELLQPRIARELDN